MYIHIHRFTYIHPRIFMCVHTYRHSARHKSAKVRKIRVSLSSCLCLSIFLYLRCLWHYLSLTRARARARSLSLSLFVASFRTDALFRSKTHKSSKYSFLQNYETIAYEVMMMIAFITIKSSLVPLIEGLCATTTVTSMKKNVHTWRRVALSSKITGEQDYTPRILFETHTERVCSDVEIAPLVLVNDMSKLCDGVLKNWRYTHPQIHHTWIHAFAIDVLPAISSSKAP